MRKFLLTCTLLLVLGLTMATCSGCSPVYVIKAGIAEARILSARRPIPEVILDPATDEGLDDLHALFGTVCALAELQAALGDQLGSDRPLRLVLDRRPFI